MKLTATVILFLMVMFSSCGGKDKNAETGNKDSPAKKTAEDKGPGTRLEGDWVIKRAEGDMASMNLGTVYSFKGSKLSFTKDAYTNPGSTVVTDSTFSFPADGNELKFMYDYHFNGDTLVVEMQNSGGQVLHLVRK